MATDAPGGRLPVVVATSVIRSADKGQSHGGVYLVDLESGDADLVIDWDDAGIDWSGRGGDRGLRGVAFWGDHVYLAASNEIFVFSREFERLGSLTNRYLKHCHEIDIHAGRLYLTSCGYDSILEYDLDGERWTRGWSLRPRRAARLVHGAARRVAGGDEVLVPSPHLVEFDPEAPGGPEPEDTIHINSVRTTDDGVFVGARRLDRLYRIDAAGVTAHGRIPLGTHNAQPYDGGILLNDTDRDGVLLTALDGSVRRSFEVVTYPEAELQNTELATGGRARQGFGRGLAVDRDELLIVGSSPATLTAYALADGATVASVNLTMDVRNAIHGLEVWESR